MKSNGNVIMRMVMDNDGNDGDGDGHGDCYFFTFFPFFFSLESSNIIFHIVVYKSPVLIENQICNFVRIQANNCY